MEFGDLVYLKKLKYSDDIDEVRNGIINIKDSKMLHVFAANYNWDNGFDIPNIIIFSENCDFGTALMMFYNADGYRMLESGVDLNSLSFCKWKDFVNLLYNRLKNNGFNYQNISYTPSISKVQAYKLKKNNPNIPEEILKKSPGIEFEIPIL